ncbi:MAG: hypothetical protein LBD41_00110 [Clostridiales Family XIII bacterium]|jgi:hypothetical protein|nr:hypothetical protein [Clostridiales Family XIII bacterium]
MEMTWAKKKKPARSQKNPDDLANPKDTSWVTGGPRSISNRLYGIRGAWKEKLLLSKPLGLLNHPTVSLSPERSVYENFFMGKPLTIQNRIRS